MPCWETRLASTTTSWRTGTRPTASSATATCSSFSYGRETVDNAGVAYVRTPGDRVVGGFSGSPVLNLRTGQVCGVVAQSLNLANAEGARILPIRLAFEGFAGLEERHKRYHDQSPAWTELLPPTQFWKQVSETCRRHVEAMRRTYEWASPTYYVERDFEEKVDSFVAGDRSAMVIVGQSGMGKTTMVARLLSKYHDGGNLCFLFESERLPSVVAEVETYMMARLEQPDLSPKELWTRISTVCALRSKCLIVFVDAVNEYNQRNAGGARPVDFIEKLDSIIWKAFRTYPRIKFVVTCRPETWRKARETAHSRFAESQDAYYQSDKDLAHDLPRFTEAELEAAYEKYRKAGNIETEFAELSSLTRYHLRDPLLLSLATEVYRGKEIPSELDTGEVFQRYATKIGQEGLIDDLLAEMFAGGEPGDRNADVVRRTSIARDSDLRERSERSRALYEALDMENQASPGWLLKDRNVLRQWSAPGETVQIRFTYDRFAEFLLSSRLLERFRQAARHETSEDAAVQLIGVNLEGAQRMNVVFGALQQMLLQLQKEPCDYVRVLQRCAEIDPRGLALVISVLARTARTSPAGIDALEKLLKNLEGKARPSRRLTRFPLIDAVYRVLCNEEYRLWLAEQPKEARSRHFKVLNGYFHWGFRHRDGTVSRAAIQYLSFLWRGRHSLPDAVAITRGLIELVSPLSLAAYVFYTEKRRLLQHLGGLMVLIIGEAEGEERSTAALVAAKNLVLRLDIHKSTALRLLRPLTLTMSRHLRSTLGRLRNPIKLTMIDQFFAHHEKNLADLKGVVSLFSFAECNGELRALVRRLARNDNSFVLEMLTLSLSAFYERQAAAGGGGGECLSLLADLFDEKGATATAQYAASLAVYHINYFGEHASVQSMELMERMARSILRERKGELSLGGETHNFNIIGTFGRALYKNGHLLDEGARGTNRRALQFAIDALQQAREENDFAYYLYVCENVGLLGVLIEPAQVFAVFSQVLSDVGAISREGLSREAVPFSPEKVSQARDRVLRSLANIRVLYRQEVDKYLLDELESTDLHAEVANRLTADFSLETFYSWSFEQLMFRLLTKYYEQMGREVLEAFVEGASEGSSASCLQIIVSRVVERLGEISA